MIRGVRRPEEIAGLGLGNRLMVRVGALLKKRLAITPAVLESARPGSALETLLLDPQLLERGELLDEAGLAALVAGRAELKGNALALATADDGLHVLCLQEEIDAGEGWGNAETHAQAPPTPETIGKSETATQASAPLARQPALHEPSAAGVGSAELERWRLKLLTASSAAERSEALRSLVLAGGPGRSARERAETLLQGLSDRDPAVRAEASILIPSLGASEDLAAALAALNHPESERRLAAAGRLLKLLAQPLDEMESGAVAVCALSILKHDFDAALAPPLLDLLRACAAVVGRNSERLAEVVRIVTGLLAAAARHGASSREVEALLTPSHRLVAALAAAVPKTLRPVLEAERLRSSDPIAEAFLLLALLDLPTAEASEAGDLAGGEEALVKAAVAFVARDTVEGRDSRAVGSRLVRRGEKALLAICDAFAQAHGGAQKYFLLLIDELCRPPAGTEAGAAVSAGLERAAQVLLRTVESGSIGVRMAAMECRLAANGELSEETRGKLARAFVDSIGDFTFRSDIEKVEATLSRMGLPALDPLLERLSPERTPQERTRAVRLLGELSLNLKAPKGQIARLQQAITNLLRQLQALALDAAFPGRGELLCALGKVVSSPVASREADAVVTRTLLEAARGNDPALVPRALEGLSYVAASRRAQADLIHATSELLRHVLDEMVFDLGTQTTQQNGETVIEITGGEKYTNVLPILVGGMTRVACSSSCPPAIVKDLGLVLIGRWKKICAGELMWGPANSLLLVEALKDLGCHKAFPPELRLEILRGFAPRHVQTPILHAMSAILAADDTPATAIGALTIGYAILGRRGKDGQFPVEDRPDILRALARIIGRKALGVSLPEGQQKAASLRRLVVDESFKGLKDSVPGAYEILLGLRENAGLAADLRADIERRLKDYHALAT